MSEVPFRRPRKRTNSFEIPNDCFNIVENLNQIISETPYLNRKVSLSMDSPSIKMENPFQLKMDNPFQNTADDDFWNSLDIFNETGSKNTSSTPQHIREEIAEMDFAPINVSKNEPFKDLGDLADMWPFGADDDEMDGSVDDLLNSDLVDSLIKTTNDNNDATTLMNDPQVIQSDLMWSSTLDKDTTLGGNIVGLDISTGGVSRRRRRDVSITLSECAEGLLTVKDMELMSSSPLLGSSPMIGSHGTQNAFFMDTPLASSESDTETGISGDSEGEDEEIDVVNHAEQEQELSSSRTRVHYRKSHHHKQHHNYKNNGGCGQNIQPGRSLLKSRHNQTPQQQKQQKQALKQDQQQQHRSSTPAIDHMFGDHSYFLVRPAPGSTGSDSNRDSDFYSDEENSSRENDNNKRNLGGMLTPTESGDEVEDRLKGNIITSATTLTTPSNIDKRKIAQAVQSLIKNRSLSASDGQTAKAAANALSSHKSTDVKFRFRMRFKSNAPRQHQKSLLNINNKPAVCTSPASPNNTDHHEDHHRVKRRSASKNVYCPTPKEDEESPENSIESITTGTATVLTAPTSTRQQMSSSPYYISTTTTTSSPIQHHASHHQGGNNKSSSSSSSSNMGTSRRSLLNSNVEGSNRLSQEDKCREIRDLHNSMERQRRVDLRKNFDMLKECVPELADNDKASKLNILNKAADYCRMLVTMDAKVKKELEKEQQKNELMRKKLEALTNIFDNGTRLSSGRLSSYHNRYN